MLTWEECNVLATTNRRRTSQRPSPIAVRGGQEVSVVRHALREWVLRLIRILNEIVPKQDCQALLYSHVPLSDNARALFEHLQANYPWVSCVWLTNSQEGALVLRRRGIQAWSTRSFHGLWAFLRSKYVFASHSFGLYYVKSRKQRTVCLWHGMPLKAMGFLDRTELPETLRAIRKWGRATDILVCSSLVMKNAMVACLAFDDPRRVLITGQPRNDKLFASQDARSLLEKALKISLEPYATLVAYLPTFRCGYEDRVEGQHPFLQWSAEDIGLLFEFLERRKALMVVKPHPLDEFVFTRAEVPLPKNIKVLTAAELQRSNVDLYEILGAFDALITDYSSVYFDYLLLERPILFMVPDLETYQQVRGFSLEPVDFWMPGPKAGNVADLVRELERLLGDKQYWQRERETVNKLVNSYRDAGSSERVCRAIFGDKE